MVVLHTTPVVRSTTPVSVALLAPVFATAMGMRMRIMWLYIIGNYIQETVIIVSVESAMLVTTLMAFVPSTKGPPFLETSFAMPNLFIFGSYVGQRNCRCCRFCKWTGENRAGTCQCNPDTQNCCRCYRFEVHHFTLRFARFCLPLQIFP